MPERSRKGPSKGLLGWDCLYKLFLFSFLSVAPGVVSSLQPTTLLHVTAFDLCYGITVEHSHFHGGLVSSSSSFSLFMAVGKQPLDVHNRHSGRVWIAMVYSTV